MFCIFTTIAKIGKLLYNTTFTAFFNGKSYFWGDFFDLRHSKMAKKWSWNTQIKCPKCCFMGDLVKKHNKTEGKKWLLNMDFLRIWETGEYKNKIF